MTKYVAFVYRHPCLPDRYFLATHHDLRIEVGLPDNSLDALLDSAEKDRNISRGDVGFNPSDRQLEDLDHNHIGGGQYLRIENNTQTQKSQKA